MAKPERTQWTSPNQLVAYNLWRARNLRGMTQEQAAEALQPYLGVRWSKATFSAAERSFAGGRVRQFTADDIVAFAQAFRFPVPWFFMPPDTAPHGLDDPGEYRELGLLLVSSNPEADRDHVVGAPELIDLIFSLEDPTTEWLSHRLEVALRSVPDPMRTEAQQAAMRYAREMARKFAAEEWGRLTNQRDALLDVIAFLDDVQRGVAQHVWPDEDSGDEGSTNRKRWEATRGKEWS